MKNQKATFIVPNKNFTNNKLKKYILTQNVLTNSNLSIKQVRRHKIDQYFYFTYMVQILQNIKKTV